VYHAAAGRAAVARRRQRAARAAHACRLHRDGGTTCGRRPGWRRVTWRSRFARACLVGAVAPPRGGAPPSVRVSAWSVSMTSAMAF